VRMVGLYRDGDGRPQPPPAGAVFSPLSGAGAGTEAEGQSHLSCVTESPPAAGGLRGARRGGTDIPTGHQQDHAGAAIARTDGEHVADDDHAQFKVKS